MDPTQMRTKGGALKSPPYVAPGQKRSACLLPPWKARIIKQQYQPWDCRREFENSLSDGNLEKAIDKCMKISGPTKLECENARKGGEEVFTHKFGNRGNIIEVFFNVDLDKLPDKKSAVGSEVLTGKPWTEVDQIVSNYQQIDLPDNAFYVALDTKFRRLFVYFSKGLEVAYGPRIGKWVLESTTYNIDEYAQVNPSDMLRNKYHSEYEKWLLDNPHLSSAYWSRAGVYNWGYWMERGHTFKGSCLIKDIVSTSSYYHGVLRTAMERRISGNGIRVLDFFYGFPLHE